MEAPAWITAIATIGLAIAAVLAYVAAKRDAAQNRQHFQQQLAEAEQARKAALKPFVVPERIVHFNNNPPLNLNVRNIGAGPALDIAVSLWFDDGPPSESEPEAERTLRLRALTARDKPTGTGEGGDIAAGDAGVSEVWLSVWSATGRGAFAYVVVAFSDIFGERSETATAIRVFQDDPVHLWT